MKIFGKGCDHQWGKWSESHETGCLGGLGEGLRQYRTCIVCGATTSRIYGKHFSASVSAALANKSREDTP